MDMASRYAQPEWHAALIEARQRRAEHLRALLRPLGQIRLVATWIGLAVVGALLLGRNDYHADLIMASIALASLLSSIAGFAFSAICGALLFHLSDDPVQVVQVMVMCSIANQVAMTWAARRDIVWRELSVYLAGGATGLTGGVWLLLHTDHARYAPALGLFLLIYGLYMLLRKPLVIPRQHVALDFVTGFLGGITGGAAGFLRHHLVQHERLGQGPPACGIPAVHPDHAGPGPDDHQPVASSQHRRAGIRPGRPAVHSGITVRHFAWACAIQKTFR